MISGRFKVDLDHAILYIINVSGEACGEACGIYTHIMHMHEHESGNEEIFIFFFKPLVTIIQLLNLVYARFTVYLWFPFRFLT
jgi:hypothetical protein